MDVCKVGCKFVPTTVQISEIFRDFVEQYLWTLFYCAFHNHANSKVQKPPSQLCFLLPSIIVTTTSNEPWNAETHKTDRNPPIRNHKPWPFEPVKVKFCFLRGPLRWLMAARNTIISWLLSFWIRMLLKSAVRSSFQQCQWITGLYRNLKTKYAGLSTPHVFKYWELMGKGR